MNAILCVCFVAASILCFSLAAYYALPCARIGATHVINPITGAYERRLWVRVAAPLYIMGQTVARNTPLPLKRCR